MKITLKVVLATLLLSLIVCGIFVAHRSHAQEIPHRIEITAKRFSFSPGDVSTKKGQPTTLILTSQDVDHGLRFRELNISLTAKKGETKEVTFTPEKTGSFTGQCSVFCGSGHGSMKLTLHVTD